MRERETTIWPLTLFEAIWFNLYALIIPQWTRKQAILRKTDSYSYCKLVAFCVEGAGRRMCLEAGRTGRSPISFTRIVSANFRSVPIRREEGDGDFILIFHGQQSNRPTT